MNTKRVSLVGLSGLLLAGVVAAPVHAAPVTEWSYSTTLEWVTAGANIPAFTVGSGTQIVDSLELSWGATGGDMTIPGTQSGQARSGLLIGEGGAANGSVFTNGGSVDTIDITHYNNAISLDFAYLESASLLSTLKLTPVAPPGSELDIASDEFEIFFTETANSSPCGFPTAAVCDDIFIVDAPELLKVPFEFDGTYYFAEVSANGLGPLDSATCGEAGRDPGCFGLTTTENAVSEVQYNLSVYAVPEPATVMLFGLGLLGLGGLVATRRRESFEASSV